MSDRVVWFEGLFLRPQHFQQQDRWFEDVLDARTSSLVPYGWGFRSVEIDSNTLALGKLELSSARGVLPDGTVFDCPESDPAPLPLEVGTNVKDELVVLAVPLRRAGTPEIANTDSSTESLARFSFDEMDVSDSHATSKRKAPIRVGRLRLQLMRQSDATNAYATLGVARVVERRPDNQLVLDNGYIPPMLHASANGTLHGYIREIVGLLSQRGTAFASRMSQPGHGGVAEITDFLMLQTVNRYEPLFRHLSTHPLMHPERLFSICLQLAGDLDTFREPHKALTAPEYQHDALARCFAPVISDLRLSFSIVPVQAAIPIKLVDQKYGVRAAIVPDTLLYKGADFVLAVNAQLPADAVRTRFPAQVKIGPADKIVDLVNYALPGIPLRPMAVAPRQIPYHAGFNYFELERGGELWSQLEGSGGIAMHIPGEFPGLELEFWAIRTGS